MVSKAAVVFHAEFEPAQQVKDVLRAKVFTIFTQGTLTIDLVKVTHLKLGTVGSHIGSQVNHLNGAFETAIMVITNFCNNVGAARADDMSSDRYIHEVAISK
jgi:hypothetical protein